MNNEGKNEAVNSSPKSKPTEVSSCALMKVDEGRNLPKYFDAVAPGNLLLHAFDLFVLLLLRAAVNRSRGSEFRLLCMLLFEVEDEVFFILVR